VKLLNDTSRFRILNKSRQIGISFIIAGEAVLRSLLFSNRLILIISSSERGSHNIINYCHQWIDSLLPTLRNKISLEIDTQKCIGFLNGSKIYSLPNNPDTVRGFCATDLYLDEFAFFEHDEKMVMAIFPSVSRGGNITIISTPNGKLNKYYHFFMEDKENAWSKHIIPYTECPDLDINIIKKSIDEITFRQEYCCEFIDEAVSFFPYELIFSCMEENISEKPIGGTIYMGIDFGKIRDATVVIIIEKIKDIAIVRKTVIYNKTEYQIQLHGDREKGIIGIEELIKEYAPHKVLIDSTGVGVKLTEDIKQITTRVIPVNFSVSTKEEMIIGLKTMMEQKRILLPKTDEYIEQLHNLMRVVTQMSNNIFYRHRIGKHDDIVWALALAASPCFKTKAIYWGGAII